MVTTRFRFGIRPALDRQRMHAQLSCGLARVADSELAKPSWLHLIAHAQVSTASFSRLDSATY